MTRVWCGLLLASAAAFAQPTPEECLALAGDPVTETASFGGREYRFKVSGCKAQFETDPERFSQLYDALRELHAAGEELKAPSSSLVPS